MMMFSAAERWRREGISGDIPALQEFFVKEVRKREEICRICMGNTAMKN